MSKPAHIIFTQAGAKSKYGYVFADYIRKHHLGVTIECARRAINLNTRRTIITWIWTPDYNALDKWASRSRHVIG